MKSTLKPMFLAVGLALSVLFLSACDDPEPEPVPTQQALTETELSELAGDICEKERECDPDFFAEDYTDLEDCRGYWAEEIEWELSDNAEEGAEECDEPWVDVVSCLGSHTCSEEIETLALFALSIDPGYEGPEYCEAEWDVYDECLDEYYW